MFGLIDSRPTPMTIRAFSWTQSDPKRIVARVRVWNILHRRGDAIRLLIPEHLGQKRESQI